MPSALLERHEAFLTIALMAARSEVPSLIAFLPAGEQGAVKQIFEELQRRSREDHKQNLIEELRKMAVSSQASGIAEIHPDWIVEALKDESPRLIATILRHLPGEQVRFVLHNLPEKLLTAMPPLSKTFSLDPQLVADLRLRFEERFVGPRLGVISAGTRFEDLPHLPRRSVEALFADLGFCEVAMAFSTLNEQTIRVILRRLPPADASALKEHLKKKPEASQDRLKQAQGHLLSLDLETGSAESLILEAAFFVYSKAVLPVHGGMTEALCKRFSMKHAALLRKYIDRNLPFNSEATVSVYQKEILAAVARNLSR